MIGRCVGKVIYPSERAAKGAAAGSANGCRPYYCPLHEGWHVGHRTRGDKVRYGTQGFPTEDEWEELRRLSDATRERPR